MKVGAIIVNEDNTRLLALGYNGDYAGGPNEVESLEPGKSGALHAEINALIKCDYSYVGKKIMYITLSPCIQCAKLIINGKINEVVYHEEYRDTSGIELLRKMGITVRQF
jgi:dCMP deaminase